VTFEISRVRNQEQSLVAMGESRNCRVADGAGKGDSAVRGWVVEVAVVAEGGRQTLRLPGLTSAARAAALAAVPVAAAAVPAAVPAAVVAAAAAAAAAAAVAEPSRCCSRGTCRHRRGIRATTTRACGRCRGSCRWWSTPRS
jgi:hypothetical protein